MLHNARRNETINLFARIARDTHFKKDFVWIADFVGKMRETSALVVWLDMSIPFQTMEEIANGTSSYLMENGGRY
jgi:hypothetical protein